MAEKFYFYNFARPEEKIFLHIVENNNDSLPEHYHDFFEIVYIFSGMGYHILNGKKLIVKKGDLIFVPYNSVHTFVPINDKFQWMDCIFLPELIDESLINSHNAYDILKLTIFTELFEFNITTLPDVYIPSEIEEFEFLFNMMISEYNNKNVGYENILRHSLFILLIKLFRFVKNEDNAKNLLTDNMLVNIVLDFIKENTLKADINLELLAKKAYLNPKYFSTLFKKYTGITITDFIKEVRFEKACDLLINTDLSVNDVIINVGYKESKFFYNFFKEKTGMTPRQYRNLTRDINNK